MFLMVFLCCYVLVFQMLLDVTSNGNQATVKQCFLLEVFTSSRCFLSYIHVYISFDPNGVEGMPKQTAQLWHWCRD